MNRWAGPWRAKARASPKGSQRACSRLRHSVCTNPTDPIATRKASGRSGRKRPDLNIENIEVGFRYRKDLGDLKSLAESVDEVGLLHPVVVPPEGRLIAGLRRLEACRILGWTEVPVTVVDLYQAARGEAHENFVRKEL